MCKTHVWIWIEETSFSDRNMNWIEKTRMINNQLVLYFILKRLVFANILIMFVFTYNYCNMFIIIKIFLKKLNVSYGKIFWPLVMCIHLQSSGYTGVGIVCSMFSISPYVYIRQNSILKIIRKIINLKHQETAL